MSKYMLFVKCRQRCLKQTNSLTGHGIPSPTSSFKLGFHLCQSANSSSHSPSTSHFNIEASEDDSYDEFWGDMKF
eukprot:6492753-Amphidinium_carterae.2